MFDAEKQRELQNRSHVRGALSKQFYSQEQAEKERKRQRMKQQLDEQMEQKRRQRENQKAEQERRNREQEQQIRLYYASMQERDKIVQGKPPLPAPYQTYPVENVNHLSRAKQQRSRVTSKASLGDGDMPLLTDYDSRVETKASRAKELQNNSYGNIPLLELAETKPKKTKKTKREDSPDIRIQTEEDGTYFNNANSKDNKELIKENRKEQISDVKHIAAQVREENKSLKNQLKKSQQAISLLIGAVRSNVKLDKFRVQAEKILSHSNKAVTQNKIPQNKTIQNNFLPKIQVKHQSILHDYMIEAAKRHKKNKPDI